MGFALSLFEFVPRNKVTVILTPTLRTRFSTV